MSSMDITQKSPNWDLYYLFEEISYKGKDNEITKLLDKFELKDFLSMPIVLDLVSYKRIRLLRLLHKKGIPLTYEEDCGGNALHVACGASGDLACVKFFVENDILTDINQKSAKHGDTPLNLASSYNHKDILDYFKQKFGIKGISFEDLDVVLDRIKSNLRRV